MKVEEAARRIWPVLVAVARNGRKITYLELARRIDSSTPRLGRQLDLIQQFCTEQGLPQITALVVGKHSGVPETGFTAGRPDVNEDWQAVWDHKWSDFNPFGSAEGEIDISSLVETILRTPENAADVYAKVRVRGMAQIVFRRALLKVYEGCTFCGVSHRTCLQAAHLIPFGAATPAQRVSVMNGILCCANHHLMFDKQELGISPDGLIHFRQSKAKSPPQDEALGSALSGKAALFPAALDKRPSQEALTDRYALFVKRTAIPPTE
jgi:putative restriction endonuclease